MEQENKELIDNFKELKKLIDYEKFYKQFDALDLKKSSGGNSYWSPCCFHADTAPSLQIDLTSGVWKCWSEQIRGDVIDFYAKYYNMSLFQAFIELSKQYNYRPVLSDDYKAVLKQRNKFFNFTARLHKHFKECLQNNEQAKNYLLNRGIIHESINKFGLGFYDPSTIMKFLSEDDIETALDVGVIKETEDGKILPISPNKRITFPYIENGRVLTFTTRVLNDEHFPKYQNFRNNSIVSKSSLLYGINKAEKRIKELKYVVLSEGHCDIIAAHQAGITNIVALSGIQPTDEQIIKLKRLGAKQFIITVEDNASLNALKGAYEKIKEHCPFALVRVVKLFNDNKCDLDDYFKTHTKNDFLKLVKRSPTYNLFVINNVLEDIDIRHIEDKTKYVNILKPHLISIKSPIERSQYIAHIAERLCLPEVDIQKSLKKYEEKKTIEAVVSMPKNIDNRYTLVQKRLCGLFLMDYDRAKLYELCEQYDIEQYLEEDFQQIFAIAKVLYMQNHDKTTLIQMLSEYDMLNKDLVNDIILLTDDFELQEHELESFFKLQERYLSGLKKKKVVSYHVDSKLSIQGTTDTSGLML